MTQPGLGCPDQCRGTGGDLIRMAMYLSTGLKYAVYAAAVQLSSALEEIFLQMPRERRSAVVPLFPKASRNCSLSSLSGNLFHINSCVQYQ